MPAYKRFKQRHPTYDAENWRICRALYAGGKALLRDRALLEKVFPPHLKEDGTIYTERCKRAFYIGYAGQLVDYIVAGLMSEPIEMKLEDADPPDEFWIDWFQAVSKPGGVRCTLNQLLREQVLNALIDQTAWCLVDLPRAPGEQPDSLGEQEQAGLLRPWAVPVRAEAVVDWEENDDGELQWALLVNCSRRRSSLDADRDQAREEYVFLTADAWERYVFEWDTSKQPDGPRDEDLPTEVTGGRLTFGRVPLLRLQLSDGLYAMGKLESIQRAHMNLRNALTWAEYKSLFPVPVTKLAKLDALNPKSEDQNRAVNQKVGQGHMLQLVEGDDFAYVGPDSAPYKIALEDLAGLRDEMHRVLHVMAQSISNSAAALGRSASSKKVDQSATATVLRALGQLVREHALDIVESLNRAAAMRHRVGPRTAWRTSTS